MFLFVVTLFGVGEAIRPRFQGKAPNTKSIFYKPGRVVTKKMKTKAENDAIKAAAELKHREEELQERLGLTHYSSGYSSIAQHGFSSWFGRKTQGTRDRRCKSSVKGTAEEGKSNVLVIPVTRIHVPRFIGGNFVGHDSTEDRHFGLGTSENSARCDKTRWWFGEHHRPAAPYSWFKIIEDNYNNLVINQEPNTFSLLEDHTAVPFYWSFYKFNRWEENLEYYDEEHNLVHSCHQVGGVIPMSRCSNFWEIMKPDPRAPYYGIPLSKFIEAHTDKKTQAWKSADSITAAWLCPIRQCEMPEDDAKTAIGVDPDVVETIKGEAEPKPALEPKPEAEPSDLVKPGNANIEKPIFC